jgi:hypothetical protein
MDGKQKHNMSGEAKSLKSILFIYMIKHPFRYLRIRKLSKRIVIENREILDMLGSDYDANGKPYWKN